MSVHLHRRLLKEAKDAAVQTDAPDGVVLRPVSFDNLRIWEAYLTPRPPSAYEGGCFCIRLLIPDAYPIQPPKVTFTTPVCHPNIHQRTGEVCLDVLKTEWSPAWSLFSACMAVLVLLDNPDASSPLNCDAGNLLRSGDLRGFNNLARVCTRLYASEPQYARPEGGTQGNQDSEGPF